MHEEKQGIINSACWICGRGLAWPPTPYCDETLLLSQNSFGVLYNRVSLPLLLGFILLSTVT